MRTCVLFFTDCVSTDSGPVLNSSSSRFWSSSGVISDLGLVSRLLENDDRTTVFKMCKIMSLPLKLHINHKLWQKCPFMANTIRSFLLFVFFSWLWNYSFLSIYLYIFSISIYIYIYIYSFYIYIFYKTVFFYNIKYLGLWPRMSIHRLAYPWNNYTKANLNFHRFVFSLYIYLCN